MKISRLLFFGAMFITGAAGAFAQGPQGPATGLNAAMTKLFGQHTAFSAKAAMEVTGGPTGDVTVTMDMAMLDGKLRSDIDLSTMQSAQLPPNAVAAMKQMGMDRIASIADPKAGTMVMIYPGLQSYVEMPVPASEAAANKDELKSEKTELGRETVGGRATVKYKVVMTDSKGGVREALMWSAPDLKDFPVKMETTEQTGKTTVTYTDVKLAKPEAALFKPPADFTKHASVQALMQSAMMRMMGGAGAGAPK